MVKANRQLNLLLDERVAPGAVFEEVTVALGYVSRLLERFPEAEATPEEPPFESGKRPANVFLRLVDCYEQIRTISAASGFDLLKLSVDLDRVADVEPSDVHQIASLLVSELAYLHAHAATVQPPRKVYHVGRKFPSHVFQRAGLLELRLEQLSRLVKDDPTWLEREGVIQ